ncbi:MAG: hypothetical protein Q8865_07535 [Bacillota bacterium]|nr:hypothetical protein [Bacillota bacterium]
MTEFQQELLKQLARIADHLQSIDDTLQNDPITVSIPDIVNVGGSVEVCDLIDTYRGN